MRVFTPAMGIILSALLYNAAFCIPTLLWWLILAFPLPLYALAARRAWTPRIAALWTWLCFGIHVGCVWYSIVKLSGETLIITLIPYLIGVTYLGFVAAGVVWLVQMSAPLLHKQHPILVCGISLWILSILMEYAILAPFNTWEGYFLALPVLPFMQYPPGFWLIGVLGVPLSLACLYAYAAGLYYAYSSMNARIWCLGTGLVWIGANMITYSTDVSAPEWTEQLLSLGETAPAMRTDARYRSRLMQGYLTHAQAAYPDVRTYITPESYWYDAQLGRDASLYERWKPPYVPRPVRVIVGGFDQEGEHLYNTLFVITNGAIEARHRKTHTMVLTERVPAWLYSKRFVHIFCKELGELTPSSHTRSIIPLIDGIDVYPYVCSEFFFGSHRPPDSTNIPILMCGSDRWLQPPWSSHIAQLMLLTASLRAISWKRPIIYATDYYFYWICPSGARTPLAQYLQHQATRKGG